MIMVAELRNMRIIISMMLSAAVGRNNGSGGVAISAGYSGCAQEPGDVSVQFTVGCLLEFPYDTK